MTATTATTDQQTNHLTESHLHQLLESVSEKQNAKREEDLFKGFHVV